MVMMVLAGLPSKKMDVYPTERHPVLSRRDRVMTAVCMVVYQGTMCLPPTHKHNAVPLAVLTLLSVRVMDTSCRYDSARLCRELLFMLKCLSVPGHPCCGGEDGNRGAHPCR